MKKNNSRMQKDLFKLMINGENNLQETIILKINTQN